MGFLLGSKPESDAKLSGGSEVLQLWVAAVFFKSTLEVLAPTYAFHRSELSRVAYSALSSFSNPSGHVHNIIQ